MFYFKNWIFQLNILKNELINLIDQNHFNINKFKKYYNQLIKKHLN